MLPAQGAIRTLIAAARRHNFTRAARALLVASLAGQFVTAAVAPVLTRLYLPDEFGVYSFFAAGFSVAVFVATMRYESAILNAKATSDIRSIVLLCALISCVVSAVGLFAVLADTDLAERAPDVWDLAIVFGFALALGGINQALSAASLRAGTIRSLGFARVAQACVFAAVAVVLGLTRGAPIDLGIAFVLGQASMFAILAVGLGPVVASQWPPIAMLLSTARTHWRFAVFSVPSNVLIALTPHLPVLLLALLYSPTDGGLFFLMQRVVYGVVGLFTTPAQGAIQSVFATTQPGQEKRFRRLFLGLGAALAVVASAIALTLLAAPLFFPVIFGPEWIGTGALAIAWAPAVLGTTVAGPLSLLDFLHRQHWNLVWAALFNLMIAASFYVAADAGWSAVTAVSIYSWGSLVFYISLIAMNWIALRRRRVGDARGGADGVALP